jgi:PTH1 family peptidyl-tRNA hydrolase
VADLLVVGLGNPGAEFAKTRHNLGAEVVEILAARHGGKLKKSAKERAFSDAVTIGGKRVALAVPTTYMNDSGDAVRRLVKHHNVEPEQLVVVHDELDLPLAALRVKEGGGLAGHNGLRSIKSHLHSDAFLRVRLGIGKPVSKERGADHVLDRFSKREREQVDVTLEQAADAVELIVTDGVQAAMNRFN